MGPVSDPACSLGHESCFLFLRRPTCSLSTTSCLPMNLVSFPSSRGGSHRPNPAVSSTNTVSSLLRHPEYIHPALWRGSSLAQAQRPVVSAGYQQLNRELPGGGWPLGTLIEIAPSQPGIGEVALLGPALSQLAPQQRIAFVHPPYVPCVQSWNNWHLSARQLLWVQPETTGDALWACEQILRHHACAALLCWVSGVHPAGLRRLHLAARQGETLFVLWRPQESLRQSSAAPLRLGLNPCKQGLEISIIKRQGPTCEQPVFIAISPDTPFFRNTAHATLDRHPHAGAQPRHAFSPVV